MIITALCWANGNKTVLKAPSSWFIPMSLFSTDLSKNKQLESLSATKSISSSTWFLVKIAT